MTPLLEAAVAAREVGLVVPECKECWKCPKCHGDGNLYHEDAESPSYCRNCGATGSTNRTLSDKPDPACKHCHATGINSDPARLGWVALMWLRARDEIRLDPGNEHANPLVNRKPVIHFRDEYDARNESAIHDGTETGIATALLRLVARAGGKQ